MVGPSSVVNDRIVVFDSTTGKLVKDSGTLISGLATSGHTHTIDNLTDVDTSSVAPSEGQALVWDNANSKWEPGAVSGFNPDGAVTFNESGAAVDFRVEGDTEQNLLLVDGSGDRVGIKTIPNTGSAFHVKGDTHLEGQASFYSGTTLCGRLLPNGSNHIRFMSCLLYTSPSPRD